MKPSPPSRAAWLVDAELNGHTVEQTIRYLSDCDDAEDRSQQWSAPPGVILAGDCEPKWLSRLRRLFGHY